MTTEKNKQKDFNAVVNKLSGVRLISQGFETKFAEALKNPSVQRKPKEISDIGIIQQSL
ncbi:hypothetical protein [uncultured Nostoc sp.]|uniref:hypothetical protein n=1 Tax=uncultured Nostoc sp. TaxID=340711 RepID=UPI0035CB487D